MSPQSDHQISVRGLLQSGKRYDTRARHALRPSESLRPAAMRHGYWRRMGIGAAWHALLPSAVAAVSGHGDNGVPYVQRSVVV